jgi:hypothetical protein
MAKFNVFVGNVPQKLVAPAFSWLSTRIDSTAASVIPHVSLSNYLANLDTLEKDDDE